MAGAQQAEVRPPAQHKKKMKQPTNVAAITYRGGTMASAARYLSHCCYYATAAVTACGFFCKLQSAAHHIAGGPLIYDHRHANSSQRCLLALCF